MLQRLLGHLHFRALLLRERVLTNNMKGFGLTTSWFEHSPSNSKHCNHEFKRSSNFECTASRERGTFGLALQELHERMAWRVEGVTYMSMQEATPTEQLAASAKFSRPCAKGFHTFWLARRRSAALTASTPKACSTELSHRSQHAGVLRYNQDYQSLVPRCKRVHHMCQGLGWSSPVCHAAPCN